MLQYIIFCHLFKQISLSLNILAFYRLLLKSYRRNKNTYFIVKYIMVIIPLIKMHIYFVLSILHILEYLGILSSAPEKL